MRLRELSIGCFGGGTGMPSVLGGLKSNPWLHVNAVVTMFDSGGSSGQLRDELGVLPPGDILKCALALSRNTREARRVLLARLPTLEHIERRPRRIHHHDIHLAADRLFDPLDGIGGAESRHAAAFGQQIRDEDDGAAHAGQRLGDAIHQKIRHQARVEAAGTDDDGVEFADRLGDDGMD